MAARVPEVPLEVNWKMAIGIDDLPMKNDDLW
jgi:hypothetical protein